MQEPIKLLEATSEEKNYIFLMSEFYKLIHEMKKVDKTLIFYDQYNEENKRSLMNLQSISAGILSDKIEVQAIVEDDPDDDEKKIRFNDLDVSKLQSVGIEVRYIKIHADYAEDQVRNIRLYDGIVNGQNVRVVTIPIEENLVEKKEIEEINTKIKKLEKEIYEKQKTLQGAALKQYQTQSSEDKKKFTKPFYDGMKQKHFKMFNIEALLHAIRSNTKKISVCGVVTHGSKNKYEQEISNIFDVPENARQFIVHTVTNQKKIPEYESKNIISSIWAFKGDKITCKKNKCFSNQYYVSEEQGAKGIRTNIYSLMTQNNNKFLAQVIENFVRAWTSITFSSSICVAGVIKKVYEHLNFETDLSLSNIDFNTSGLGSNKNLEEDLSDPTNAKQSLVLYSYEEILKKYGVKENKNLRTNETHRIKQFFDKNRLAGIQIEKNEDIIPKGIQCLTFLHYFYKINQQFCSDYSTQEKLESNLTQYVLTFLKSVYELAKSINTSDALKYSQYQIKDMQNYFDFLDFLFQSMDLIKTVTGREIALCGSMKTFFDQLKPKENRFLTYILNNQDDIKENQPIHYYDLYLKIIRQCSKGLQTKIQFIYVIIHRFKADKISSQYSYDKRRVVQAIKSYSEIIHQYDRIPETKKDRINKLHIEKRIARLLMLVGLPDEAARVYMKNHLVKSAQKCFKQILQGCKGDEKSKKYIQFGEFFESELSFYKAVDYYELAYEAASTTGVRQQSIQKKLNCVLHAQNIKEEEKRIYVRYCEKTDSEQTFLNSAPDQQNQFSRLRNRLGWDESKKASVILDEQEIEENMIY